MDKHDEQFEAFLRQFRLREVSPLPEMVLMRRRSSTRLFVAAAAAVLVVGVLSTMYLRNSSNGAGPKATVEVAGNPSVYRVGEMVEAGSVVRSNSAVGLLLALEDGSRVEMHAQSELKLEAANDGIRVRLIDGSILVTAAKQDAGHLYVQTRDAMVSVVGTVFFVNAEQSGTRVAVVEGEVHVQQGAELKKLFGGEQVATNPSMNLKTVAEEISWSRNAVEYAALLQRPAAGAEPSIQTPVLGGQVGDAPEIPNSDVAVRDGTRPSTGLLPFKVQANYVKVTTDQVRTLITVQLLIKDLAFQDEGGAKVAHARVKGVIYRSDNSRIPGFDQDFMVRFATLKSFNESLDRPNLYQETRYLTPGKYKLNLTVEDKNSQNIGVQDFLLDVPRIPDQTLQASSMILADSMTDLSPRTSGTEMFALGDKKVKPNVTGVFRPDQDLNVWQEIYGFTVDQATRKPSVTLELVISQNKREIKKLATNSTALVSSSQSMTYTNSVPLGNFAPGQYEAQIKVTDNLAKASFVTTREFSVVASQTAQSNPPIENAGRRVFDRQCTACHSAEIAMRLGSIGTQFSISDRELLASKRAEVAELTKTLTDKKERVREVQEEIAVLVRREAEAKNSISTFVFRHLTNFGGTASGPEFPMLINYIFEATGKKLDAPIPSDIPFQFSVPPRK